VFNDGGTNYDFRIEGDTVDSLFFVDASAEAVGIGTAFPGEKLHVAGNGIRIDRTSGDPYIDFYTSGSANNVQVYGGSSTGFRVFVGGSEKTRVDTSGRLLVGTSTARSAIGFDNTPQLQVEGTNANTASISIVSNANNAGAPVLFLAKSRGGSVGSNTAVQSGDGLGLIQWSGNDGSQFEVAASIACEIDGTPGADDMPGRLIFSTTADGASSPTQRMVIKNNGLTAFFNGTPTFGYGDSPGFQIAQQGYVMSNVDADRSIFINRKTNDGGLIEFAQDGAVEGSISVSGSTVSYNGAHLSRWSQLPDGAVREEILRGTVLSNIDEMCSWGEEDNEQLNRMQVSDVEGDPNVSGVFQAWDDDDDTYTDDFYCAMTGDFIIRIAEGITVQRGDLLMSAGDGTAKPQDDDIIRSKTIAKVTSTHVTCTYDDGSYCVPCVLMAC
jgi:hypothetical protein